MHWEATAINAERGLAGSVTIPVDEPLAGVDELMADLPPDEN
jgi:hypothetical protein